MFTTSDVSLVKQYVQRQCSKLLAGTASIHDCIFAKEYRGRQGYMPGACVPALEIARLLLSRIYTSESVRPSVPRNQLQFSVDLDHIWRVASLHSRDGHGCGGLLAVRCLAGLQLMFLPSTFLFVGCMV